MRQEIGIIMRVWNWQGKRLKVIGNGEEKLAAIQNKTIRRGYLEEQEKEYGLVSCFSGFEGVMDKIKILLEDTDLKSETKEKSARLIRNKCDVTLFLIRFIEEWPESFEKAAGN